MMRRRRPVMRGAMVAGAGYAAGRSRTKGKAAEQDQNQRIADLEAQQNAAAAPAPPPPAAPAEDNVDKLLKLKGLLDDGVLSQAEFDAEKAKILAG